VRPVGSKYLLVEPLGRGATGTVWRASQRETAGEEAAVPGQPGETVAIKVLKEELASDSDVVMRFLRERSVLLRLTHPNIVRTRDLVVEGDLLALVMDLVDGPDLHRYLRENGPFSPVGAALLTAQIADALAASHAQGVVHRDLKPANVLLKGDEGQLHPMLTDFGIARLADSPGITRTQEFVGTPAYVAPESAEGRPQTSAVDVYGAGILMYELLTGRPPFSGATSLEVLQKHLTEEPRRPTTVPEPLWTVIERCLRKDPGQRPSATNLATALRTVAPGIGVHATPGQVNAALGVAALLAPDPSPATVPEMPGAADPTQVLPAGGAAAAPTQVLPGTSGAGAAGLAGALGAAGAAAAYDPDGATNVMPTTGPGGQGMPRGADEEADTARQPDGPHPWQGQLQAARERNEQTQVQYLDPSQDPLRHRPHRQPPPRGPRGQEGYGSPAPYPQQPQQYRQPQPQYGQPAPQQRYAPPRQPQQYAPPQEPGRRREREPRRRSANPVRIPGLGCLKGCLIVLVVLFVVGWLVWDLTPLQQWVAQGESYWNAIGDGISKVTGWISDLGGGGSGN
jgi:serine/threonine protein kinase, bacterial